MLLVVLFITSVFMYWGKKSYRIVVPTVILLIVTRYVFPLIIRLLGINVKGIERIVDFFSGNLIDGGRAEKYIKSLEAFSESPVFGNGIGSIFYNLNSCSFF